MKLFVLGSVTLILSVIVRGLSASVVLFEDLKSSVNLTIIVSNVAETAKAAAEQATSNLHDVKSSNPTEQVAQGASAAFKATQDTVETATQGFQNGKWEKVLNFMKNGSVLAAEAAEQGYNKTFERLQHIKWKELPDDVQKYIIEHPYLTAFEIVWILTSFACPGLVMTPTLRAAGFGILGPVAGKYDICILIDHLANPELLQSRLPRGCRGRTARPSSSAHSRALPCRGTVQRL